MKIPSALAGLLVCLLWPVTAFGTGGSQLVYYNGPVITAPKIMMLYVGDWSSPAAQNAEVVIERWVTSIGNTRFYNAMNGYHDNAGHVVANANVTIDSRYFDPDMTNPMNATNINAWVAPILATKDLNTIVFQVPSPTIDNNCGGAVGCRGAFPDGHATMISTAFNGIYLFEPTYSGNWYHELTESMLNSNGNGWSVVANFGPPAWSGDIADTCDYGSSPFWIASTFVRTTNQDDGFELNGVVGYQMTGGPGYSPVCVHGWATILDGFWPLQGTQGLMGHTVVTAPATTGPFGGWAASTVGDPGATGSAHGCQGAWFLQSNNHISQVYPNPDLHTTSETIGTTDWGTAPAGYQFAGNVDVASMGDARADAFALGYAPSSVTPHLFHRYWDWYGGFGAWLDMGDGTGWGTNVVLLGSAPGAVSSANHRIDVFVRAVVSGYSHTHLIHLYCSGTVNSFCNTATSGWHFEDLGEPTDGSILTGDPDVSSWGEGRLDAFCTENNGNLFHLWMLDHAYGHDTWLPPSGIHFANNPSVVGMGDYRLYVAARDQSNVPWSYLWNNAPGSWSSTSVVLNGGIDFASH